MTRKGTIIIAVLVNACLLIFLFITATTSEEELLLESSSIMHPPSMHGEVAMQKPLFEEPEALLKKEVLPLQESSASVDTKESAKQVAAKETKEEVIHKLPKIAGAKPEKVETQKKKEVAKTEPLASKKPIAASSVSTPSYTTITVKKGDTLERIAKRYGSTVKEIVSANHLPSTFLRIGQILKIPQKKQQVAKDVQVVPSSQDAYYVVKPGDNPWTIAMKHHMKVNDLLKLNHLDEKKAKRLKPGDRLRIR